MKLLTFAAGLAAGYVLGSRAGREAYEQIVAQVGQARRHPTVVQAQEKAKDALGTGVDAVNAKLHAAASDEPATPRPAKATPQRPRHANTTATDRPADGVA
ncbi:hypothetical protein ACIA5C_20055 [Actinoplanes sp. NPDC051343]|jgi:hypothetical protein|uniref:hypothetical protein n=1 Tax=Actinoplanes sp. NPDC051343 TaxID=3363906 RepID=UPI00379D2ED7